MKYAVVLSVLIIFAAFQNFSKVAVITAASESVGGNGDPTTETEDPGDGTLIVRNTFKQPKWEPGKKVDILFVVDTSSSLDQERQAIADGLDQFIINLPANADYNIGVLLAHGSGSAWTGKLYQKGTEPVVLKSANHPLADIRTNLKSKLSSPAGHAASDGGEAGLFAMTEMLTLSNRQAAQAEGMFRTDAALAVVFVSDENDICASYPAGVTPVPDDAGLNENKTYAKDCVPNSISAGNTYKKLKDLKANEPLIVGAIIYTGESPVPVGGENEIGYGYTDIVKLAGSAGLDVDMAGNIANGLADIGKVTSTQIAMKTSFIMKHDVLYNCHEQIDPNSVSLSVDNKSVPFNWLPDTCEVQIDPKDAGVAESNIVLQYRITKM